MAPQFRIRLATTVSARGEHATTLGEEISAEEADVIQKLLLPFNGLGGGVGTVHVQEAWTSLVRVMSVLPRGPSSKESDVVALQKMVTWLAAFRTYLNHQQAFWERHYPHLWSEVQQATSTEFNRPDKCYAMTSDLRNYADHVDTAGISIRHTLDPATGARASLLVGARDALIEMNRKKWHRTVLPVLQSQPTTFDLMPVFTAAMHGLVRIHDVSDNILLLLVKNSLEPLRRWANRAPRVSATGPSSPALVWENLDPAHVRPGASLSLRSVTLIPHNRLDALELALTDPRDPLAATRLAFERLNAETDAALGWPPAEEPNQAKTPSREHQS